MKGDIDSINHVGVIVSDYEAAVAFYEALGFVLSPLSMHKGSLKPGEPKVPFGTGNRSAIFGHNYIELLAHVHKEGYDFGFPQFIERFEGAHIIVFGCGDASVVETRLTGTDLQTSGVIRLERDVEGPNGIEPAKFDCIHYPRDRSPEGLVQAAEHLTPELIHQPHLLRHPNGATALAEVVLCSDDPARDADRYAEFLGLEAVAEGRSQVFTLPRGDRFTILGADGIESVLPGCVAPALPFFAGSMIAVQDIDAVAARLAEKNIGHTRFDGRIGVPAETAFGHMLVFVPA